MISLGFAHGVHPPESKELTNRLEIRRMPYPEEVVLPLRQHAGKPAKPIVAIGDHVQRGDKIAEADGFVSAPVHASAAGVVEDIALWPHPDGSMCTAIRISVSRYSAQAPRPRLVPAWESLSPSEIVRAVPEKLDAFLVRCLDVDPLRRFCCASTALEGLEHALRQ